MIRKLALIVIVLFASFSGLIADEIGTWGFSSKGLPIYQYTGNLPFHATDKNGKDSYLPNDPYFLLGNYRMTLITHASGIYQFLTAERVWARVNSAVQPNYGCNDASIVFKNNKNKKVNLVGLESIATNKELVKKEFGVGFARYNYQLENGIACTRMISVKPSAKINTGNPAFVVTVVLKNNGKKTQELTYSERMLVNFGMNGLQNTAIQQRPILYHPNFRIDSNKQMAIADISYKTNKFLVVPEKNESYNYDINPPSVFMFLKNISGENTSVVSVEKDTLAAQISTILKSGQTKTFHIVIGFADGNSFTQVQNQVDDLLADSNQNDPYDGIFADLWKRKLPDLSTEKNEVLKREMLWNAHMLEASATYSDYYKETFIPQGTVYSYHFGDNISNRDHLQAALPACYTNAELAKSCIRFVIKHTAVDGEIKRGDSGFGYTAPSIYKESDEQLFFFNTISEYLLFLNRKPCKWLRKL